jgi:pimeloyl-ACP methyl ester carboxylesterase
MFWYLTAPGGGDRDIVRVRCPTRIIHGEQDRLVPVSLAEAALRRRPDWELHVLRGCGHLPQLELPDEFIAACANSN